MQPKKANSYILPTAKQLSVEPKLVECIVDFYWKQVRKALSELQAPRVIVANFGTFRMKSWKLDEQAMKYNKYLVNNETNMTFAKHRIRADIEQRLSEIAAVSIIVKDDYQRKQNLKEKRKDAKSNNNLEKS